MRGYCNYYSIEAILTGWPLNCSRWPVSRFRPTLPRPHNTTRFRNQFQSQTWSPNYSAKDRRGRLGGSSVTLFFYPGVCGFAFEIFRNTWNDEFCEISLSPRFALTHFDYTMFLRMYRDAIEPVESTNSRIISVFNAQVSPTEFILF